MISLTFFWNGFEVVVLFCFSFSSFLISNKKFPISDSVSTDSSRELCFCFFLFTLILDLLVCLLDISKHWLLEVPWFFETLSGFSEFFLFFERSFLNLINFWSSVKTAAGFMPALRQRSWRHIWHLLRVLTVTKHLFPNLHLKLGSLPLWWALRKNARHERQTTPP